MRCPRCTGGGRRAAGAEPAANTSWRRGGELRIAVWGARRPQARKSHPAGAEVGRGRARGAAVKPPRSPAPLPTGLTSSSIPLPPSPLPSEPLSWCRGGGSSGGGGTAEPSLRAWTPRGCCGPRSSLPGAAVPVAKAASRADSGAARLLLASASSFSASPRTRSRARSSETAPGCSYLSHRRLGRATADRGRPVAAGSLCE